MIIEAQVIHFLHYQVILIIASSYQMHLCISITCIWNMLYYDVTTIHQLSHNVDKDPWCCMASIGCSRLTPKKLDFFFFFFFQNVITWVRSQNCGCLVTWFWYQLIAKPRNKTAAVSWPRPYFPIVFPLTLIFLYASGPTPRKFNHRCGYWWPGV